MAIKGLKSPKRNACLASIVFSDVGGKSAQWKRQIILIYHPNTKNLMLCLFYALNIQSVTNSRTSPEGEMGHSLILS